MLLDFPIYCPVFGMKLTYCEDEDNNWHNTASLDRINPDKGYVLDNVKVISRHANRLKSNATLTQLERIVQYVKDCKKAKIRFYFNPTLMKWRKMKRLQDEYGNYTPYGKMVYHNRFC